MIFVRTAIVTWRTNNQLTEQFSTGEVSSCAGFSDAWVAGPSIRAEGRRPRSAKAGNRGMWGGEGAAGSMAI